MNTTTVPFPIPTYHTTRFTDEETNALNLAIRIRVGAVAGHFHGKVNRALSEEASLSFLAVFQQHRAESEFIIACATDMLTLQRPVGANKEHNANERLKAYWLNGSEMDNQVFHATGRWAHTFFTFNESNDRWEWTTLGRNRINILLNVVEMKPV